MSFEQSIVWLLLGAVLGSGGAVLAGKSVMKRREIDPADLEEALRAIRLRRLLEKEESEREDDGNV